MRPFLSAQSHLLPVPSHCPDYEGMQHYWKRSEFSPEFVILSLTDGRVVRFRLRHVRSHRLRQQCPEHLVHRAQVLKQGA